MQEILNRTKAPEFSLIDNIEMIKASEKRLSNNIPVYCVHGGTQELLKIEFIFEAGMFFQAMPLQAASVNALIEEGTSKLTAAQIAEQVDFYGAFLETSITQDSASVTLFTLSKHLPAVLPIIEQVIKDAVFPQNELEIHLKNKKQLFHLNNKKVANVARKHFSEILFGAQHPYGILVEEQHFSNINRDCLLEFYNKFYNSKNCKIIVAGKTNESILPLLEKHFGKNDWEKHISYEQEKKYIANFTKIAQSSAQKKHLIEMNGEVMQSAIRVGKLTFNKTHPDFLELQVLNTLLGGYFGSRLMMNIREDKGYTYGIGSGLVSFKNGGYFFIATEVGVEVCSKALDEIFFEIKRLRTEPIHEQELDLVKNFMLGAFLRSIDGPLAMAEKFKGIMEYNLSYDYYDRFIATIKNISTSRLKDLATTYLNENSMIELVAGKK